MAQLRRDQDAFERFEAAEGWRREDVIRLRDQLDHHWADVVTSCVRADDPLAFGIDKLRHARTTTLADLAQLDAAIPPDRSKEWEQSRRQIPDILRARHAAERELAEGQAALQQAARRRWGRRDHDAIAAARAEVVVTEQRTKQAVTAEHKLRERLDTLSEYQEHRRQAIADCAPTRQAIETTLTQLGGALDHTRPDRINALVEQPPPHLVEPLGPPPASPAGRAVWCHHALRIEAVLDRNDSAIPFAIQSRGSSCARQEIALADRYLEPRSAASDPTEWANLAHEAANLRDEVHRNARIRAAINRRVAQTPEAELHPAMDNVAAPQGPELSL